MYGNEENQGLMKQLSTRVGIIKKLRKYLPPARLRVLYEGVFSSKLLYGMAVWGRVWQIPGSMDEDQSTRTSPSLTKEDVRKLQVLQNKCMRLMTDSDYKTPTRVLLAQTNLLSVHQQMAHVSLSQVYNIWKTKLPTYHYKRIFGDRGDGTTNRIEFDKSLARSHFFYQSSRLWGALPDDVKSANTKQTFKKKCRKWIKSNIMEKP